MTNHLAAQIATIETARDTGKPIKAIARDLGISPARVTQIITVAGLSRKVARPHEAYVAVGKLRASGLSLSGIGRHLGVSKNVAAGMVRKAQSLGCGGPS